MSTMLADCVLIGTASDAPTQHGVSGQGFVPSAWRTEAGLAVALRSALDPESWFYTSLGSARFMRISVSRRGFGRSFVPSASEPLFRAKVRLVELWAGHGRHRRWTSYRAPLELPPRDTTKVRTASGLSLTSSPPEECTGECATSQQHKLFHCRLACPESSRTGPKLSRHGSKPAPKLAETIWPAVGERMPAANTERGGGLAKTPGRTRDAPRAGEKWDRERVLSGGIAQ